MSGPTISVLSQLQSLMQQLDVNMKHRGCEILEKSLHAAGVETIFTVPSANDDGNVVEFSLPQVDSLEPLSL